MEKMNHRWLLMSIAGISWAFTINPIGAIKGIAVYLLVDWILERYRDDWQFRNWKTPRQKRKNTYKRGSRKPVE